MPLPQPAARSSVADLALAVCGVYVGVAGLAGSGSSGGAFGGPCIATTDTYGETTANYRGNVGRCGW